MAGMLPGVECARRRRFHQSGDSPSAATHGGTRRSSFCLYASNHESIHNSVSSLQRIILSQVYEDEKLGGAAREAKERLDERLKTQRNKSESKRSNSSDRSLKGVERNSRSIMAAGELQTEVFGVKKNGLKRFNWARFSWKAGDQDECTICLEGFKSGDTLVHLPCAHRFHTRCLVPWLENNAQCPCCRMDIRAQLPH